MEISAPASLIVRVSASLSFMLFGLGYTPSASAGQVEIPGPAGSASFGARVVVLPNGNMVITDPGYADRGAIYLYSAAGQQISKLTGSPPGSNDGSAGIEWDIINITVLANGNYVIDYPQWSSGATYALGAVTWGSAKTGVSGVISANNSLIGTNAGDHVGREGVIALANGNYLVGSTQWVNEVGQHAGALTWGNGQTGVSGNISAANSMVGGSEWAGVGSLTSVAALTNGNYVVHDRWWINPQGRTVGAARWCDGSKPCLGFISESNSLIGTTEGDGAYSMVTALTNGNYVITFNDWDNGPIANVGAVVWADGKIGVAGQISAANALIGSHPDNYVGYPDAVALTNGNYVVKSSEWEDGAHLNLGAVTWGDGSTGTVGVVSSANSIVGSSNNDLVGQNVWEAPVVPLANGNYVVNSNLWDDGEKANVGAVRWADGTKPSTGPITVANALIGGAENTRVGNLGVSVLANGNYMVNSAWWPSGEYGAIGATTWGDGEKGTAGVVSAANSITGAQPGDGIGAFPLSDGNYVAGSSLWQLGATTNVGATMWVDGSRSTSGVLVQANSLTGSANLDYLGLVYPLSDGSYLVGSQSWNKGATKFVGLWRWLPGKGNVTGVVSEATSLTGDVLQDNIGNEGIHALPDGFYIISSYFWDNGDVVNAGAVTLGRGNSIVGKINPANSVVGTVPFGGLPYQGGPGLFYDYDASRQRLVVGRPASKTVSLFTLDSDLIFTNGFEKRQLPCGKRDWGCGSQ